MMILRVLSYCLPCSLVESCSKQGRGLVLLALYYFLPIKCRSTFFLSIGVIIDLAERSVHYFLIDLFTPPDLVLNLAHYILLRYKCLDHTLPHDCVRY